MFSGVLYELGGFYLPFLFCGIMLGKFYFLIVHFVSYTLKGINNILSNAQNTTIFWFQRTNLKFLTLKNVRKSVGPIDICKYSKSLRLCQKAPFSWEILNF